MPVNPTGATPKVSDVVAPVPSAPAVNDASASTNDGTTIIMPNVSAPARPLSEGEVLPDAGDDAELIVLHAIVGEFPQGSRITRAQLGENVDIARLLRLEAVAELKPAPVADAPQVPAKGKAK